MSEVKSIHLTKYIYKGKENESKIISKKNVRQMQMY